MSPLREDIAGARQLRFRVDGQGLHLFKPKGQTLAEVHLKVAVYALYTPRYELVIDPRSAGRFKPDVASFDLTGEVRFWGQCGDVGVEAITHALKHTDATEVVIAREALDLDAYTAQLKRQIHYRYTTDKLRIVAFRALEEWFDPQDVQVPPEAYDLHEF